MGYQDLPAPQVASRVLRTRPSQGGCLRARPSGHNAGSIPVWATRICRLCKSPAASCGRDPCQGGCLRARPSGRDTGSIPRMGYHDLPAPRVASRVLRTRPSQGGCLRARPSGRDTGSIPVWATTICRLCKLPAASSGRDPLEAASFVLRALPGATRVR